MVRSLKDGKAVTKRALRCSEFQPASEVGKHPACATSKNTTGNKKLDGGGRSKGLIRAKTCAVSTSPK